LFHFFLFLRHECNAYHYGGDETHRLATGPLTEEMKADYNVGHPTITPADAGLETSDTVARVEAIPHLNFDVVGLSVNPSATEGVARRKICSMLIERLEDVGLFLSCCFVLELKRC
jgi:hypothetical protein